VQLGSRHIAMLYQSIADYDLCGELINNQAAWRQRLTEHNDESEDVDSG
jgi:hypothetical protein